MMGFQGGYIASEDSIHLCTSLVIYSCFFERIMGLDGIEGGDAFW